MTALAGAAARAWAPRFVLALLLGTTIIRVALIADNWGFEDVDAYWDAALRLRAGEPLYPTGVDPDHYRVFRYSPWFAWAWVPLTFLPRVPVELAWGGILALAAGWLLVAVLRLRGPAAIALALLMTPWLLSLVQVGNIQPLVVAALAYGVSRSSGPAWVGVTASLKAVPALWALVYVARRQWARVALAAAVTVALLLPLVLVDTDGYTTDPGASFSLYYYVSPLAWAVAAAASVLVAAGLALRRSRWTWLAVAVAAMAVAPRSHVTYATYLLVAVLHRDDGMTDG